jgi:hypothetical protein
VPPLSLASHDARIFRQPGPACAARMPAARIAVVCAVGPVRMHGTLSAMQQPQIPGERTVARPARVLDRRPTRRTLAAVAIGLVGVLVSETAATHAPVALPMLLATGILGAMVRPGWGGPGATWLGGAIAEGGTALVHVLTRPADVAWQDSLVPLFFLAGIALFSGIFFAGFALVVGAHRFLGPRWAERALRAGLAALLAWSLVVLITTP